MSRWLSLFAVLLICLPLRAQEVRAPERIFVNGKIWTGDERRPLARALAVRGDRILAVGEDREIRALATAETSIFDLRGRLVVPGFNDAHWHLADADELDLSDVKNVAELQKRVTAYAAAHPAATWVTGRGWGYAVFPDRVPRRKYLDALAIDRPVFLWERDGHMALANSRALAAANVTRDTPDPEHGRIEREADGELTGEVKESAIGLIRRHVPERTPEERYQNLHLTMRRAASYGLTSVQNASPLSDADLVALNRVLAEGAVTLRFYLSVPFRKNATPADLAAYKSRRENYRGPLVKFGSAKGFLDGTVDARTASMFEPYTDGSIGIPMWTAEELNEAVALYDRENFQIMLHAIGDKAIHLALDAYEQVGKMNGAKDRRHRIEHIEVPLLADLPRFKQLGVIASTQAIFANPDATSLEHYAVLLGPARDAHANAFKLFDDAGAVQAFGSDYPVFSMEVLPAIYAAVARRTPAGQPAGGWYPQNRISVEAALRHFTRDSAYASFDENLKGTLAPGKLADFVVLSEDILSGPPERLLKTKVLLTVMGGRDTYRPQ
ncbi:MAG TPA: amidohydrolase [Pyrinomonadaceae bacterium]|nr:amidohydrolase [Pyrinomonadaceae bacterium]